MPGSRSCLESLDEIAGASEEAGAIFDQTVAAFAAGIERRAWDSKDLAALLGGKPGGDERA